ncbi:4Fe-4S dicluster domain-containing protein [Candidatus Laterigemmans baculatus]|uniref:4Fe-4S dicluster domain-containing protein n=1 Tax=Candidatus Laterigemmans baculatus TaxID=2770505 RepID=UPI0013DCDE5D|nr:4Fe-4S dicluster domain-containing protein [Candidatus Laterigemmans baculatus]
MNPLTPPLDVLLNAFPPRYTPVPDPEDEPTARMGFFTDTTLCIGCKACEVACKQWNQLPSDGLDFTGNSYDNTGHLSQSTWRHVAFKERHSEDGTSRWLMMSDVCKHCEEAPCLQACPTGSLIYNEFGDVYLQNDICNGCGYCVVACPFGVLGRSDEDGHAHKCTMCYDRQSDGMEPACAKVCPTNSIQFGPVEELREQAKKRVEQLQERGRESAYLYGADAFEEYSSLNAFFLLEDHPNHYNLPEQPKHPFKGQGVRYAVGIAAGVALSAVSALFLARED